MKNSFRIVVLLLMLSVSFQTVSLKGQLVPQAWPDVLNLHYTPSSPASPAGAFMADQGAWFGFGLPYDTDDSYCGAFTGPWLMNNNPGWISNRLIRFTLLDPKSGKTLGAANGEAHSLPGWLEQSFRVAGMQGRMELVFASGNTALIRATLINTGSAAVSFVPSWQGCLFANTLAASLREDGVWLSDKAESRIVTLRLSDEASYQLPNDSTFSLELNAVQLSPKAFVSYVVAISFFQSPDETAQGLFAVNELLENPASAFDNCQRRWKGYLSQVASRLKPASDSASAMLVAVKSVQTLVTNWRMKQGTLLHAGVFPSSFYRGFYGFWAWDSWKQAAACAWFHPALAREQIRLLFSRQDSAGMVPDVIYENSADDNFRDTKPPLAAWAVNEVYEATGDKSFVKQMLPQLLHYHQWWFLHRDADGNGLCSWGSTDGTLEAANWESGMDNAIRFDQAELVKSGNGAWCMKQESPDLNGFLYAEKVFLARLLSVAGRVDEADAMLQSADRLKVLINKYLWNEKEGFYFDRYGEKGAFVSVASPEGWLPLWAGVADTAQAQAVAALVGQPDRFRTLVPFPSVEARASGFAPEKGYWRGPVWLDQAYFALAGLRRYGLNELADSLQHQLLLGASGINDKGEPLYENYHPVTGAGLNAPHFSWSAAHLLLLLMQR
ncbi:MAG: trehalase family glycosidase [Bacteroidales bacterium]|nr:trehalase family glycosidase [Bacteroidales bacterium]